MFKFGDRYYELKNPMLKVEPLRNLEGKKEMLFWTPEEFRLFAASVSPKYKTFFNFLYVTGCRKGEALALSTSDIDYDSRTATINKSLKQDEERRLRGYNAQKQRFCAYREIAAVVG